MSSNLHDWIGRTETRSDSITIAPMVALSATLDRDDPEPQPGDSVPPLWNWLWFLPRDRQSDLGEDGIVKRGGFLPPVPLPRRMWAGARFQYNSPLRVGDRVTRVSRVLSVEEKKGRTGPLVFVTVRHELRNEKGPVFSEEHDIVYRDLPTVGSPVQRQRAPEQAQWVRTIRADDVLLFRFSALTFNGHRIHYDRRYAVEVEGYPGLVVHGPLIATLLADLLRRNLPEAVLREFAFRSVGPLFDTAPFSVCGNPGDDGKTVELWAKDAENNLAMTATAKL